MANNRIYYAIQQVGFKDSDDPNYTVGHGVQTVGITTSFNLEQVFEMGQLAIYENIEEIPDIEVTMNKTLDGYPLIYCVATKDDTTTAPTLNGRANTKTKVAMSIFPDTNQSAAGSASSIVECSGMYVSSVSYNFPLDDNFTEDVTLVGNDKIWLGDLHIANTDAIARAAALSFDGDTSFADNDDSPLATTGVNRRQDLLFTPAGSELDSNTAANDADVTTLPPDVYGITSSGTNELVGDTYGAHVSNITVSADFGREAINELGRKGPYHRFVSFPVEVTCEIEVTSVSGDMVSATEDGILTTGGTTCSDLGNLTDRTIRIATCEGTRLYLGRKNKLSSVSYSGGDTGGGNVSVSYSYTTFNDFVVMHENDPHASASGWWTNRASGDYYLLEDMS